MNQLCAAEIALELGDRASAGPLLDEAQAGFRAMEMHRHADEAARLREDAV
jgi:hypothetical protein